MLNSISNVQHKRNVIRMRLYLKILLTQYLPVFNLQRASDCISLKCNWTSVFRYVVRMTHSMCKCMMVYAQLFLAWCNMVDCGPTVSPVRHHLHYEPPPGGSTLAALDPLLLYGHPHRCPGTTLPHVVRSRLLEWCARTSYPRVDVPPVLPLGSCCLKSHGKCCCCL